MHAASDLAKLNDAIQFRLKKLKGRYSSLSQRAADDHGPIIAGCVIELDNLAVSGLREFTISSLRRARTVNGHRISVNRKFGPEGEIAAYVLSVLNNVRYVNKERPVTIRRSDEPTVRDPKDIEKVLVSCAASNLPSLQTALSLNVSLFRDISTVRNFYAHRNQDTWRKVRDKARTMGVLIVKHPDTLVRTAMTGRPVSLFEDWVAEAELFFEELTR